MKKLFTLILCFCTFFGYSQDTNRIYIITQLMGSVVVSHFTYQYEVHECCVAFISVEEEGELETLICGNYSIENISGLHLLRAVKKEDDVLNTIHENFVPK